MVASSVIRERRAIRVVVAVLALVVPSASCALIVGDVEGHHVFPGADGGDATLPDATAEDAASGATSEGGNPEDGSPPAADASDAGAAPSAFIHCAQSNCPAVGNVCCLSNVFNSFDGGACATSGQCFAPSVSLFCASAVDCAAQGHAGYYCCGSAAGELNSTNNGFTAFTGAQCLPSCPRATMKQVLCDPGSQTDVTQCAALDAGCTALSWTPSGYYSCQ